MQNRYEELKKRVHKFIKNKHLLPKCICVFERLIKMIE